MFWHIFCNLVHFGLLLAAILGGRPKNVSEEDHVRPIFLRSSGLRLALLLLVRIPWSRSGGGAAPDSFAARSCGRTHTRTVRRFTVSSSDSCLTNREVWNRKRAAQTGESAASVRVSSCSDRMRQWPLSGAGISSCTRSSRLPSARARDRRRDISLLPSSLEIRRGLFERISDSGECRVVSLAAYYEHHTVYKKARTGLEL